MDKAKLARKAKELVNQQRVGVLCTAVDGLPYGSPLAFVAGDRLEWIAFASFRGTRKHQALTRNPEAAFVIDNRSEGDFDPSSSQALIATGVVAEVSDQSEDRQLKGQLRRRCPNLEEFLVSSRTVVFKFEVRSLIFVEGIEGGVELPMEDLGADLPAVDQSE